MPFRGHITPPSLILALVCVPCVSEGHRGAPRQGSGLTPSPSKSMFLPLHWYDRDLGGLIHHIPSPPRCQGEAWLGPTLVRKAQPRINAVVMAMPGNFRPEATARAAAGCPITPGFPPGTAQCPAGEEGCGVGAAQQQHLVPRQEQPQLAPGPGGHSRGIWCSSSAGGSRLLPLQHWEHHCPREGWARERSCCDLQVPPAPEAPRVLSLLRPRGQLGNLPGRSSMPGVGDRARTTAATPTGRAGWVGAQGYCTPRCAATGAPLHTQTLTHNYTRH